MNVSAVPVGSLTYDEVLTVLNAASAAPSLHNSQPWQFRCDGSTIALHADFSREIPIADPDHRELMLACGAALLNLRLAVRNLGVAADVRLLPDPDEPTLLAVVRPMSSQRPTVIDQQLSAAINSRHTNRRPFLDESVPESASNRLRQAARVEQSWLAIMATEQHSAVRELLVEATRTQQDDPRFTAEWEKWTGRANGTPDGVPASSSGPLPDQQDMWVFRDFSAGTAHHRLPGKDFESDPLIAVIGSLTDLPVARLQAGQAMQRVLLTATAEGLSASFLSQLVEVPATRHSLRDLIGSGVWPQAVLRIGYGSPVPRTPRRDMREVATMLAPD